MDYIDAVTLPGHEPYVEQDAFWRDFLLELLLAIRVRLVAQVRLKYIVMLDEHIYVQEVPPAMRRAMRTLSMPAGRTLNFPPRMPPGHGRSCLELDERPEHDLFTLLQPRRDLQKVWSCVVGDNGTQFQASGA